MKLVYDENSTKDIVQNYYKTYEDIDGELTIVIGSRKVSSVGRFVVYQTVPTIEFRLKGSMKFAGKMHPVDIPLSEDEIRNVFITMAHATGRNVKCISIDYNEEGFEHVTVEAFRKRKIK